MKAPAPFLGILFFIFSIFNFASSTFAANSYLHENFTDSSIGNWQIERGSSNISVSSSGLVLNSPQGITYPYLYLKNWPANEDYIIDFEFKMNGPVNFGSGIIFSDKLINIGTSDDLRDSDFIFQFWPASENRAFIATRLCELNVLECNEAVSKRIGSVFDSSTTIGIKIEHKNSQYKMFINGELVFTSKPTSLKIDKLWIGNPQTTNNYGCVWTNITINHIYIDPITDPIQRVKTIIIPGFGASWNLPAILTGLNIGTWEIPDQVSDYKGLITSFENAGYHLNEDLFVFPYDWRKNLSDLSDELKIFIDDNHLNSEKINIVGHSMGGLVARAYAQKYGTSFLNKLITAGSPNNGLIKAYGLWEGAEVGDGAWWEKALIEIATEVNRRPGETKINAIRRVSPSIKDLLPTNSFLTKRSVPVPIDTMAQKNNFLINLNATSANVNLITKAMWSEDRDTKSSISIIKPSLSDLLSGRWEDGKPTSSAPYYFASGDGSVTKVSAVGPFTDSIKGTGGHGELVSKVDNIKLILDNLDIDSSSASAFPSDDRSSSFVAVLRSPGNLHVCNENRDRCDELLGIYIPTNKLFILPGYNNEKLIVQIIDSGETGPYSLHLGNIHDDGQWEKGTGRMNSSGQIDTYYVAGKYLNISADDNTSQRNLLRAKLDLRRFNSKWDKSGLVEKLGDARLVYRNRLSYANDLRDSLSKEFEKSSKSNNFQYFEASINMWNAIDLSVQNILSINKSRKNISPSLLSFRIFEKDSDNERDEKSREDKQRNYFTFALISLAMNKMNEASEMPQEMLNIKADKLEQAKMLQEFGYDIR